jgi:molybdate transport system substrate-binding protein
MIRRLALAGAAAVLALAGTACTSTPSDNVDGAATTTITVAAAASLTDVFETIGAEFTASSGIEVTFSFAASSAIGEQIRGGAPLDAFASAGTSAMKPLADEQLVTDVTDFATNTLAIAVPAGNPGGVNGLADLARVSVVVCEEQVPCGVATTALLERNALAISPVSFEPDVRSVLGKIVADEADAGIVYVTDLVDREGVEAVSIPVDANVSTTYQAAIVTESPHAEAARAFVAFLDGPEAQAALAAAGFAPAP